MAKHLFGGNYDLVRRVGLVGAYGFINGRPVTLLIRVEGSMNFNTASEFRRVYSFAQAGTVVILLRTDS
ncbi:hypothetical protein [Vulcanisaeta sp. JCM 16161]|uniref:hypothetical protein n=1 Tax=Vulcanisaeta sp. JCM 16161 TaxID=1295372 RepID=UPI0006D21435|nr:hypothetical protein [Vulcanisaeta sp. JCM 16161]